MLIGVVGPSGAGKDTLLEGARTVLAGEPIRFVRRAITRPGAAGGEDHQPMDVAAFEAARTRGAFALSWGAHGLFYGIPADIADDLARGGVVVANLSRGVLAEAAARFPLRVAEVTAPVALLAARLAGRGREDPGDIVRRLAREAPLPAGLDVVRVVNDGTVEEGIAALVRCIRPAGG